MLTSLYDSFPQNSECVNHAPELKTQTKGKKMLVIKNMKDFTSDEDKHFEETRWTINTAILLILDGKVINHNLENLYCMVNNIHSPLHKIQLYDHLRLSLEICLTNILYSLTHVPLLLPDLDDTWRSFCKNSNTVRNIFLSIDTKTKQQTVKQICMDLFKTRIVLIPNIKTKFITEVLFIIDMERRTQLFKQQKATIKSVVKMLVELEIYQTYFEVEYLSNAKAFYIEEGSKKIKELNLVDYMLLVSMRMGEEIDKVKTYLTESTVSQSLRLICQYMIEEHMSEIFDKGFKTLIDTKMLDPLKLMYFLMNKVPKGRENLQKQFSDYILNEGTIIVSDPKKFTIEILLNFREKLDKIVTVSFANDQDCRNAIRMAFDKFINLYSNKTAMLLAKFMDQKLKDKNLSESDLEVLFDKAILLFRFIHSKDIFEAFYKRHLANRLLNRQSTSKDAEGSFINRLKIECGTHFIVKIEGMFKDIYVNLDLNAAFQDYLKIHPTENTNADVSFQVLTHSTWPTFKNYSVNLPQDLLNYQALFQKFYFSTYNGRKLTWHSNLGHSVMKASFENGNKELQAPLFHTVVLLLFNSFQQITLTEIIDILNLDEREIKKTLHSLTRGKIRLLNKKPMETDIKDDDKFEINEQFKNKLFRVKIIPPPLKESPEDEKAVETSVMMDRQLQIDAAIVRIMKKNITINHNDLLSELFEALGVPVKAVEMKKRVELLIERDYMQRDQDNPEKYIYVA
ncbi:cullin-4B-like [Aethina tumida]|uniref:cullin-4B-like n=1 Tax=Aethina tumida TaxID=116153 RepID=UPI002149287D|nr:cullin-4B-like [Aethina tumida]